MSKQTLELALEALEARDVDSALIFALKEAIKNQGEPVADERDLPEADIHNPMTDEWCKEYAPAPWEKNDE